MSRALARLRVVIQCTRPHHAHIRGSHPSAFPPVGNGERLPRLRWHANSRAVPTLRKPDLPGAAQIEPIGPVSEWYVNCSKAGLGG